MIELCRSSSEVVHAYGAESHLEGGNSEEMHLSVEGTRPDDVSGASHRQGPLMDRRGKIRKACHHQLVIPEFVLRADA